MKLKASITLTAAIMMTTIIPLSTAEARWGPYGGPGYGYPSDPGYPYYGGPGGYGAPYGGMPYPGQGPYAYPSRQEHGGRPAMSREHAGKPAMKKEHAGRPAATR